MRRACMGTMLAALAAAATDACAVGNGDADRPLVADAPGAERDASRPEVTSGDAATVDAGRDEDAGASADGGKDGATSVLDDAGTFMVVRVGSAGSGVALSADAAPVFIEERRLGDGVVTRTIAMPTAAVGGQGPFTLRGSSTTEGGLSLTSDGAYVVLAGYAAVPGTADVSATTAASTPRIAARVSKAGVVDTSTKLDAAFDAKSVRGAASVDGASFYVGGENGSSGSGGVFHVTLGATGGTHVLDTLQNLRMVGVFDGRLYGSTQSGAAGNAFRLFSVGTGLPVIAGQTATGLPGTTDVNTLPHGFVMLDRDAGVPGVDTMYVADTRSLASGGGVQKWRLVAGSWTLTNTFKAGLTGAPIAVAAKPVGSTAIVVCVTLDNPAKIVRFVDDEVNLTPEGVTLGSGTATFAQYRGIALAPP
jgi:hypothetical protein